MEMQRIYNFCSIVDHKEA